MQANSLVPDAVADIVQGFLGLDNFRLKSYARIVPLGPGGAAPKYSRGELHALAPEDLATIYNISPLYQAGFDGAGQSIAVVGQSAILLSDIRAFRTRFNLPANDPKIILYGGADPGFNGAQVEGNLDLEWAGAVAPKATLYYVYGASALTAITYAVNQNIAPIISISYGNCESFYSPTYYRSVAQQGNVQGITFLSASGDSGAAGCDPQGSNPFATRGRIVDFPSVLPEITAVGGTQFVEGFGNYWSSTNSPNFGSALSYIPEQVWNESDISEGLLSSGGGSSLYYPKPAWQNGPGVPDDNVRHVPDISLTAAAHDPYLITYKEPCGCCRNLGIRAGAGRHRRPSEPISGRQWLSESAGAGQHQPATLSSCTSRSKCVSRYCFRRQYRPLLARQPGLSDRFFRLPRRGGLRPRDGARVDRRQHAGRAMEHLDQRRGRDAPGDCRPGHSERHGWGDRRRRSPSRQRCTHRHGRVQPEQPGQCHLTRIGCALLARRPAGCGSLLPRRTTRHRHAHDHSPVFRRCGVQRRGRKQYHPDHHPARRSRHRRERAEYGLSTRGRCRRPELADRDQSSRSG